MKKLFFVFVSLFVLIALAFGQDPEPPTDIFDAAANFKIYMATLGGIAVLSIFLTGVINGLFKVVKSWVRLVISWGIPIVLTFVGGFLLKIGFLNEASWWVTILYGFGAGLVANRGYDALMVQNFILFIENLLGNKEIKSP